MEAIQTRELTKRFGDLTAVNELTLEVQRGEIFGLVGPDGAGKTTTMRMLTSIMDPTYGDAHVMGKHIVRDADALKEETGYMSQRFGLYPDLTVLENIYFYADIYGVPPDDRHSRIEELLNFSNLAPFRRRQAKNLSGGMKQKLGLACALIHTPKVLFLDEPTNGVDPVSRRDFWRILYRLLNRGVTIFVSTAYLDEADRCHRVAFIDNGRLLACDSPDQLRRLLHGSILEVRTVESRRVFDLLRTRFPSNTVGLFGDRLHVVTTSPRETARSVSRILKEAQLPEPEIRTVEPTLEDVFVSVLAG